MRRRGCKGFPQFGFWAQALTDGAQSGFQLDAAGRRWGKRQAWRSGEAARPLNSTAICNSAPPVDDRQAQSVAIGSDGAAVELAADLRLDAAGDAGRAPGVANGSDSAAVEFAGDLQLGAAYRRGRAPGAASGSDGAPVELAGDLHLGSAGDAGRAPGVAIVSNGPAVELAGDLKLRAAGRRPASVKRRDREQRRGRRARWRSAARRRRSTAGEREAWRTEATARPSIASCRLGSAVAGARNARKCRAATLESNRLARTSNKRPARVMDTTRRPFSRVSSPATRETHQRAASATKGERVAPPL